MNGYTSGKTSHDPEPWKSQYGNRYNAPWSFGERIELTHDPRPEFDNHNPILEWFRAREQAGNIYALRQWIAFLNDWDGTICKATPDQIAHAFRVLSRLAALS